jgi:hypothetical protein
VPDRDPVHATLSPDALRSLQAFAAAAEAYCAWAESDAGNAKEEAQRARRLLAELFRRALDLPQLFADVKPPEIAADDYSRMFRRFGALPFNYYAECFDPLVVPAEEPVTADLADDLADIWRDVKSGLLLFARSELEAAAWQWRFHFVVHWGHHASAALYALQSWCSANDDELT